MTMRLSKKPVLLVLASCLLAVWMLFTGCSSSVESMTDSTNAEAFLNYALCGSEADAYAMLREQVTESEFAPVWADLRTLVAGATDYELDARKLKETTSLSGSKTMIEQTYLVTLNNGRTFTYRIVMYEGSTGLAGMHFRDVTDFLVDTDRYIPAVNIALGILALLFLAFRIWMVVDCLRRPLARRKTLWVIVLLLGVTLTLTVGESIGVRLGVALLADPMSLVADPIAYALLLSLSLPVGAFVYYLKRKTLPLRESAALAAEITEPPTDLPDSES